MPPDGPVCCCVAAVPPGTMGRSPPGSTRRRGAAVLFLFDSLALASWDVEFDPHRRSPTHPPTDPTQVGPRQDPAAASSSTAPL